MTIIDDTTTPAPADTDLALRVEGLRVATLSGHEILHGVDFEMRRGEVLGLVGESGSGKTTAGLACLGHYRTGLMYTGGTITLYPRDGSEISILDLDREKLRSLRGSSLAYIPQDPALSLNPAMRVGEQIREVLDIHGFGKSSADRRARVAEVLQDVDLPSDEAFQRKWPHELSGGMQQRIGIAMAFTMNPEVLILDEPTTGLDVSTQAHVLDTIRAMTKAHNVASLYITHDLAVVAELSHKVAVMLRGEMVEVGGYEKILTSPDHPYTRRLLKAVPDLAGKKDLEATVSLPIVSKKEKPAAQEDPRTVEEPVEEKTPRLLEVRHLEMSYGKHKVLRDINMHIEPGGCTMLLGESGSGKTTLARSVAGLNPRYTGSVLLRGEELETSTRARSLDERQDIQYVFQSPFSSLNPRRTIGESLTVPLNMSKRITPKERVEVVKDTLEAVQLDASFYDRRPGDLSGGERQRAAIARALVNAPSVLVCDEITSALDVSVQASIIALLNHLRAERGLAMLFVTHNITLARHVADRIAVLNKGLIVDNGTVDQVLENPSHEYTRELLANVPTL